MLSYRSWKVVQRTLIQTFWDVVLYCWLSMVSSIPLKCQAATSPVTQHHIPEGLSLQQHHCENSNHASYILRTLYLLMVLYIPYVHTPVFEPSPHSLQLLHYSALQVFICTVINWFLYCQFLSFKLKSLQFLYNVSTSHLVRYGNLSFVCCCIWTLINIAYISFFFSLS